MAIIGDDFTFAKSNPFGKRIPYGSAGDCFSMHFGGKCRRGHFKVDLSQTGLRLKPSVRWKAIGFPPGIEMHEYKKSKDGTMVSAKCGGWCGQCRPVGEMLLEQTVCSQEEGELIDGAFTNAQTNALFNDLKWKIYTKDGPSLSSAPSLLLSFSSSLFVRKVWATFQRLFYYPLPLRGFCTLPSLPRRDIQDGGQSEMFSVKMSVNSLEDVLLMIPPTVSVFTAFNAPWNQSMSVQEILLSSGKRCQMSVYKRRLMPCVSYPFSRSLPIDCV